MKVIINFTNEQPPNYVVKEVENNNSLKGTLITIANLKLVNRVAGFNIIVEGNKRFFFICNKEPEKKYYELKKKVSTFEELLESTLNIIQTLDNSTKEKDIYKLLKTIA